VGSEDLLDYPLLCESDSAEALSHLETLLEENKKVIRGLFLALVRNVEREDEQKELCDRQRAELIDRRQYQSFLQTIYNDVGMRVMPMSFPPSFFFFSLQGASSSFPSFHRRRSSPPWASSGMSWGARTPCPRARSMFAASFPLLFSCIFFVSFFFVSLGS
jgi:hypothetical protein